MPSGIGYSVLDGNRELTLERSNDSGDGGTVKSLGKELRTDDVAFLFVGEREAIEDKKGGDRGTNAVV